MSRATKIRELRRWCLDLRANPYDKALLHCLIQYTNAAGECWPAVKRIALESGMSERKARMVIQALEDAGHLQVNRSKGRSPSVYKLVLNTARGAPLNGSQHCTGDGVNAAQREPSRKRQHCTSGTPTLHSVQSIGNTGNSEADQEEGSTGRKREVMP